MSNAEFRRSGLTSSGLADTRPAPRNDTTSIGAAGRIVGGVIGWHGPLLLLVLFAVFPLVVVDSVWSADIGARLYQAKIVLETGQWTATHPLPRVDPEGLYFPLHLSAATDTAFHYIPYPKRPLLVLLTAAQYRIAGLLPGDLDSNVVASVVGLHTLSTFAAALGTARLVARSRPRLAIPAMWFTGLVSPLFVDGYVGHAHSLAAACFVWATVALLGFTEPLPPRTSSDVSHLAGAGLLVALACLLRTESFFLGAAISAGLVVAGWRRPTRNRWWVAAVVIGVTTVASTVADRLATPATTGPANPLHGGDPWGGLMGRVEGVQRTLLSPGGSPADLLILGVAVAVLLAGHLVGRERSNHVPEILLAAATGAALVRVVQGDMVLVFGLVLACPLLFVGLMRLGRAAWSNHENRFHVTTTALFAGAVAATQYRYGGGAEWGGRYFAIGLPSAIVLAVQGLDSALGSVSAQRARRLIILAVIPAMVLNFAGLYGIRRSRIGSAALVDAVAEATATVKLRSGSTDDQSALVQPDDDDRKDPIVVTTVPAAGRLSWSEVDNGRWLLVDKGELAEVAGRLSDLEVRHWILLTTDADEELAEIGAVYRPEPWERPADVPADIVIVTAIAD